MATAMPIKVLIVDDESIVRKGLRSTVPWAKYGMEVVADAPNGRKAWDMFLDFGPQVVITDIVMPEMDGIELSRKVKETAPETKIILLSCHREFEYAQQGMRLGASGYLLKTAFEDEELETMLAQFQRDLTAAPRASSGGADDERLGAWIYAWLNGQSERHRQDLERLTAGDGEGRPAYAYLLKREETGADWRELLGDASFEGAKIIPYDESRCFLLLPQSQTGAAEDGLIALRAGRPGLTWARRGPLADAGQRLDAFESLHKEAELERVYGFAAGEWPEAIARAVRLLHDRPEAEWSVSEVAGMVGLSRSHFSILFKKTLGDSFVAFQYKRKLKVARRLLAETALTMQEIAEKTGLSDSKYFSKWFKRCTGETPSHYRARQKSEALRTE